MNSLEILNKFSSKDEHGNRIWKESEILEAIDFAKNQAFDNCDILEKALDEVANPIKYMKLRLKEGERLNGLYANTLSNSAVYLKEIANKALSEKNTEIDRLQHENVNV